MSWHSIDIKRPKIRGIAYYAIPFKNFGSNLSITITGREFCKISDESNIRLWTWEKTSDNSIGVNFFYIISENVAIGSYEDAEDVPDNKVASKLSTVDIISSRFVRNLVEDSINYTTHNGDRLSAFEAGTRIDICLPIKWGLIPNLYFLSVFIRRFPDKFDQITGISNNLILGAIEGICISIVRFSINSLLSIYYIFDETKNLRTDIRKIFSDSDVEQFRDIVLSARWVNKIIYELTVIDQYSRELRINYSDEFRNEIIKLLEDLKGTIDIIRSIKFIFDDNLRKNKNFES